jgi:hypothetical protein
MDVSKIAIEIQKANSRRKLNWPVFLIGLVLFLMSYMYLRNANYKSNSISSANPFGVSYTDAYNSKQLDTIRDVPNCRRLAPFTPATNPTTGNVFLGVSFQLPVNFFEYENESVQSGDFNTFAFSCNINIPINQYSNSLNRIKYTYTPSYIDFDSSPTSKLFFQNEENHELSPVVIFSAYSTNSSNAILVYDDYDIVLDGVPVQPNFLFWSSSSIAPLVEPSNTNHATYWYGFPTAEFFQDPLSNGVPNPFAGRERIVGNGDLSQIPFLALNQVYVVSPIDFTNSRYFVAPSNSSFTIQIPVGLNVNPFSLYSLHRRSYLLRDSQNLSDGTCISTIGVDVSYRTLHPSNNKQTWIVLNGTWTLLPEFVFFDSSKNENPLVVYIKTENAQIPITLANLTNRWIVMSSTLSTPPHITEPTMTYLNTVLGVPLNAYGRQGMTIMSSSTIHSSVFTRTILSVKGLVSGNYFWFSIFSSWVAGFVGDAYIADSVGSTFTTPALQSELVLQNDISRTFLVVMFSYQSELVLPLPPNGTYCFILTIVGTNAQIVLNYSLGSLTLYPQTATDQYDPNPNYTENTTPVHYPLASVSYLVLVNNESVNVSQAFGYSKSMLLTFKSLYG